MILLREGRWLMDRHAPHAGVMNSAALSAQNSWREGYLHQSHALGGAYGRPWWCQRGLTIRGALDFIRRK